MKPKSDAGFEALGGILDAMSGPLLEAAQGEPGAAQEPTASPQKPRKPSDKLARAAAAIAQRPDKAEKAFLALQVVQCSLPRSNPGDTKVWVRRNGDFSLVLEALTDPQTLQSVGLPSGSVAKILWLWINTQAVFNKNSADVENKYRLTLGRNLKSFLLALGLDPNTGGGKFSHAKAVKEELTKLLRCHISFHYNRSEGARGGKSFVNLPIARSARLWWDFTPAQKGELECEIILDEAFFEAITAVPVPVDMRVAVALMRSPLAIDLYAWATYRIFKLRQARASEIRISLAALKEQFGDEYKRADHFKEALAKALEKVKEVWPELDYTLANKALVLRVGNAQPSIAPRGEKRRNPALEQPNLISAPMRAKFETKYPLHDVDEAFAAFDQWRTKAHIVSRDTDAHFWNFVTNHLFKT